MIVSKTFGQHFSIALFHDGKVLHQRCLEGNWNHVSQRRWEQNNESWLMWNPQISPSFNQKTIWLCFSLLQLLPPCQLPIHTSFPILSSCFSEWSENPYFLISWENEETLLPHLVITSSKAQYSLQTAFSYLWLILQTPTEEISFSWTLASLACIYTPPLISQ